MTLEAPLVAASAEISTLGLEDKILETWYEDEDETKSFTWQVTVMKINNIFNLIIPVIIFFFPIFFSCQKEYDSTQSANNEILIEVSINGVSDKIASSTNNTNRTNSEFSDYKQEEIIDLGLEGKIRATLIDETLIKSSSPSLEATVHKQKNLTAGVRYRVIAYDMEGNYAAHQDYIYGQENSSSKLKLIGGIEGATKTYTFIVYSMNSQTQLPDIPNLTRTNLSQVTLNANPNDGQLLFDKIILPVKKETISLILN